MRSHHVSQLGWQLAQSGQSPFHPLSPAPLRNDEPMVIDLDTLNKDELLALRKQVDKAFGRI